MGQKTTEELLKIAQDECGFIKFEEVDGYLLGAWCTGIWYPLRDMPRQLMELAQAQGRKTHEQDDRMGL